MIQAEIDGLIARTERIQHYADRRIAHYDPRGVKPPLPTFNVLEDAIKELEKLVLRYYLIIKAVWMDELMPAFQYDWLEIFYVPWMQRPRHGE